MNTTEIDSMYSSAWAMFYYLYSERNAELMDFYRIHREQNNLDWKPEGAAALFEQYFDPPDVIRDNMKAFYDCLAVEHR
ncbi:MAG: DUF1570 domain-containing protein [Candidatus Competibacteraceae bacterium]|nr:DUF1570 domain-containing protein [Candidatus Competibacteraceae bacterium]